MYYFSVLLCTTILFLFNRYVATGSEDNSAYIYDIRKASNTFNNNNGSGSGNSGNSGSGSGSGSEDESGYDNDSNFGGAVMARLGGHSDVVSDVAFHPLHPQIVICSFDRTIRFYTDRGED